jgi:hypothetical protein
MKPNLDRIDARLAHQIFITNITALFSNIYWETVRITNNCLLQCMCIISKQILLYGSDVQLYNEKAFQYLCPSVRPKMFITFFSVIICGSNLIFGHRLQKGQSKVANPLRCPWSSPVEVTSDEGMTKYQIAATNNYWEKFYEHLGTNGRTEVKQYSPPSGGARV